MEALSYIGKAQLILSRIQEKCKDIIDMESKMDLVDFGDFKLSSADIVEYENMTSQFLENLMHVDVNEVMHHGFLCSYSECETTFFLGKKRVLTLMIHILQDITLFRNTLKLDDYIRMFSAIMKRQLAINIIENTKGEISSMKSRNNELKGLLRQIDSRDGQGSPDQTETKDRYEKELTLLESGRRSKETNLKIWEEEKENSGIEANKIDAGIKKKSDDDMFGMIMTGIIAKPSIRSEIRILLRKVIYLRNLDNLCNALLNRSNGIDEAEVQRGIDEHQKWINFLERVSGAVNELLY